MALLNANNKIMKRAERIARRAGVRDTWWRMAAIAQTVTGRDMLELRAMWRRCDRPLEKRTVVVGGKVSRFLAP